MNNEPARQVHLDFHTSELIPGIGSRFSKEGFQRALTTGRINLINLFSKCHHGWSYYPTKIGSVHPNLDFDLLGSQIEACHEIDVIAPIYYTVGWSALDAENHPEWSMRNADGTIVADGWDQGATPESPKPVAQWKSLCPTGDYHDRTRAQTIELMQQYPVDGMWYDIYQPNQLCYCERCRAGMTDSGYDVDNPQDVERYRGETIRQHCADLVRVIESFDPEASIYFNGLTQLERPENFRYRLFDFNTKNDLEDLPTTWGGYDKLPVRSKLFHLEKKPVVAMSGKFHTSWGEFGGFKDPEAIRFEAASMIAFGARCNFGDQLHPNGAMDPATYENIGHAYKYVEEIEEYGIGGLPEASLGFWASFDNEADVGMSRMLLEEHFDFEAIQSDDDLDRFEAIVVPSRAGVIESSIFEIERYLSRGGRLLVLAEGLLDTAAIEPVIESRARYLGTSEIDIDYTVAAEPVAADLPRSPFLNYTPALRFIPDDTAERLASIRLPYFSRTYGAYCGHQNTPYDAEPAKHPAIFQIGRLVVMSHPLDRIYYQNGAKVHRTLFRNTLRLLHRKPMIEANLPSAGRLSLLHHRDEKRYVAHLLYGPPIQRGRCEVIEDLPTLHNITVTMRLPKEIRSLRQIPGNNILQISKSDDGIVTNIPSFSAHCAIVAEY